MTAAGRRDARRPTDDGQPLGVKGAGQAGCIAAPPTIISQATASSGTRKRSSVIGSTAECSSLFVVDTVVRLNQPTKARVPVWPDGAGSLVLPGEAD
jgi:hypothetical protein